MAMGYDLSYDSQAPIAARLDFERLPAHYRHDHHGYCIGNPKLKAPIENSDCGSSSLSSPHPLPSLPY